MVGSAAMGLGMSSGSVLPSLDIVRFHLVMDKIHRNMFLSSFENRRT